ncbi:MAG: deoxyribose-phosphate aldolase [Desulfuromonadales bacterium]|nr:deoxyribose-phosphate aldolase [Desulfuromonadales bacterium]
MLSPAPFIDHTLLKPEATGEEIRLLCEEAVEYGFAAVCVPPVFVSLAVDCLYGSEVRVATVVGFPFGYSTPATKAFEAAEAVAAGAREIDLVIHWGGVRQGGLAAAQAEIAELVRLVPEATVKVILECCHLEPALQQAMVERAVAAGAAFVKTSTGFGPAGATVADVQRLVAAAAGRIRVKAAGGIRDWPTCRAMLEAGASRIGTSAGVAIVHQWQQSQP